MISRNRKQCTAISLGIMEYLTGMAKSRGVQNRLFALKKIFQTVMDM